jgi:D-glycero-alpha-D-manno-heptose-7-phosphate kinase
MIISKTPLRMSWVGGGSDLPAYYREELGAVLSTSIDKYVYIALNPKFDNKIRLNYSKTEEVTSLNEIEHPIFREALKHTNVTSGIEIASMADIPSKGSGLGSSSSFTVGLLNALYAYKNQFSSNEKLASEACDIEMIKCNEPIGKQDQYAAAYGGINLIKFHANEIVSVEPIICKPSLSKNIEDHTLIFYTGRTRSASKLLAKQSEDLLTIERKKLMRRMVDLAFELKNELESDSIQNFGQILHENWMLKSQLTKGITDNQIDGWYQVGLKNGALGGKLLGAGNGGFIMFFAPPETHSKICTALSDLQNVKFKFENSGSQIVFYQPKNQI